MTRRFTGRFELEPFPEIPNEDSLATIAFRDLILRAVSAQVMLGRAAAKAYVTKQLATEEKSK